MVDISGLDKVDVLRVLYDNARPQGMGILQYTPKGMTREQARELLERTDYFDYVSGRVMKVSLKNATEFDEWGYDRDNGTGAAQRAVDGLRKTQQAVA